MRSLTLASIALSTGLALALPARAAETPSQELTSLLQCAAASGLYNGFVEAPDSSPTDADKALVAQMAAVDMRFQMREQILADSLGDAAVQQVVTGIKADMSAKIEPLRAHVDPRREVIDLYRPVMVACIARGATLPAT